SSRAKPRKHRGREMQAGSRRGNRARDPRIHGLVALSICLVRLPSDVRRQRYAARLVEKLGHRPRRACRETHAVFAASQRFDDARGATLLKLDRGVLPQGLARLAEADPFKRVRRLIERGSPTRACRCDEQKLDRAAALLLLSKQPGWKDARIVQHEK